LSFIILSTNKKEFSLKFKIKNSNKKN